MQDVSDQLLENLWHDPLSGNAVSVLYVKGSGGDLARVKLANFATLNMDQVLELEDLCKEQEPEEDEVADLLAYTNFNLNTTPRSIDNFANAFIPFPAAAHYAAYYERQAAEDTPKMRNAKTNVVLVPGLGWRRSAEALEWRR